MKRVAPRLGALEARVPRGCRLCVTWFGTVLAGEDGTPQRPERCCGCGRLVPITALVRVIGVDLALV